MRYDSIKDLPESTKDLSSKQKKKYLQVANSLIGSGSSESEASEGAMKEAKKVVKSKSFVKSSSSITSDEMISYEIVYEPNVKDAHGEWMSEDTIRKGRDNFEKNKISGNVKENLFHLFPTEEFTIEKTWIQEEFDVFVGDTNEKISAGSWIAKVKYNSGDLWELKKAGVVGGLSIQCSGYVADDGEITGLNFDPEDFEEE